MQWLAWDSMSQPSVQPPSGPLRLPSALQPAWLKVSLWCDQHSPQRPLPIGLAMLQDYPLRSSCSWLFLPLGSQWGLGLGSGSQGFTGIGQRQEVVGGEDPPHFPKAIFTHLIMLLHLCHLKLKSGPCVPIGGYLLESLMSFGYALV